MILNAKRFQNCPKLQEAANNIDPLRVGKKGEAVEVLQQALVDLGFAMPGSTRNGCNADGIFGVETEKTVRAFQALNGLERDGIAGRFTLGRLDALFVLREQADRQKIYVTANAPSPLGPWFVS